MTRGAAHSAEAERRRGERREAGRGARQAFGANGQKGSRSTAAAGRRGQGAEGALIERRGGRPTFHRAHLPPSWRSASACARTL